MKNSLFKRISRIVTANVENVISKVENANAEGLMKQAINEVEEVIEDVKDELAGILTTKHLATKQLTAKNNLFDELSERIKVALENGKEDLAKSGVAEQLDIEAQIPIIEKTIADCLEEEKTLESYLKALKGKINEMNQDILNLKEVKTDLNSPAQKGSSSHKKFEQAEKSFDRVFNEVANTKGMSRPDLEQKAKLKELEDLERDNRINERLMSYKK